MSNVYQAPRADLTAKRRAQKDNPITQEMMDNIEQGRFWAKFLGILLYLLMGLLIFAGIVSLFGRPLLPVIMVLAVGAFILFKMGRFLTRYSYHVLELTQTGKADHLVEAQEAFRLYVKWLGVITILTFVLPIVIALFRFI